jgi:hypothetical protein
VVGPKYWCLRHTPKYLLVLGRVAETKNGHTSTHIVPSHRAELGHWFPFGPRFVVISDAPFPRWLRLMLISFLARFPSGFVGLLTPAAGNNLKCHAHCSTLRNRSTCTHFEGNNPRIYALKIPTTENFSQESHTMMSVM